MITNERIKTDLKKEDFFYDLPEEQIAQSPAEKRDCSRLMVLNRENGSIEHKHFYDVIDYLNEGDVLVINDSRVIPARIYGDKVRDEGAFASAPSKIETLLLKQLENNRWEVLLRPAKKVKIGGKIDYNGILEATVCEIVEDGNRIVEFSYDTDKYSSIYEVLDIIGSMPLPPYITEKLEDKNRYQTVYARENGSSAAPTAGLHFTKELLEKIKKKGIKIAPVMLHVGLGTFRPVKAEKIEGIVKPLTMATDTEIKDFTNAMPGSLGPKDFKGRIIVDRTAAVMSDFYCGANETGFHLGGVNWDRDVTEYEVQDIRCVVEGDPSPDGKGTIVLKHGIEVGQVFELGTKYSQAMNCVILDENGKNIVGTGHMVFNWFEWERDGKDIPKIHPAQKSVKVLKKLIETFTDPGDVVIDPCCGSASHCLCAKELNRKFVGIELDEKYFNIAKERINQAK